MKPPWSLSALSLVVRPTVAPPCLNKGNLLLLRSSFLFGLAGTMPYSHCVCCLSTAVTPINFNKVSCKCWFKASWLKFPMCRASPHQASPSPAISPSHLSLRLTAPDLAAGKSVHQASQRAPRFPGRRETSGFRTARFRVQRPSDRPASRDRRCVPLRHTLPGSAAASAAGARLWTAPRVGYLSSAWSGPVLPFRSRCRPGGGLPARAS